MSMSSQPVKAQWVKDLEDDAKLGRELVSILQDHCGERGASEGAVETLQRIIRERAQYPAVPDGAEQINAAPQAPLPIQYMRPVSTPELTGGNEPAGAAPSGANDSKEQG